MPQSCIFPHLTSTRTSPTNNLRVIAVVFPLAAALPDDLRLRTQAGVLAGHGHPVWQRSVLGGFFAYFKSPARPPTRRLESLTVQPRRTCDGFVCFFPSTGGAAGHEHQADGANEKKTGVHGSAAVQQIRSRCLLSHPSMDSIFLFFWLFLKTQCVCFRGIIKMFEFAHVNTLCCIPQPS